MKEIIELSDSSRLEDRHALATVVDIAGSGVRGVGATMLVSADGAITGSVSGGCIEGEVMRAAVRLLEGGDPLLLSFCEVQDPIFGTISPCGGTVSVMIYPGSELVEKRYIELIREGKGALWGVSLDGESASAGLLFAGESVDELVFSSDLSLAQLRALKAFIAKAPSEALKRGIRDEHWFAMMSPPPVNLCIVGGGHISVALSRIAKALAWRVVIVDPREAFLSADRFPEADAVLNMWPKPAFEKLCIDKRFAVAALSHDSKIDDQAIFGALDSDCFYAGVLGSRKTLAARRDRLAEQGISAADLALLRGPIGLNIGAKEPEEIALAVAAEIVETVRSKRG